MVYYRDTIVWLTLLLAVLAESIEVKEAKNEKKAELKKRIDSSKSERGATSYMQVVHKLTKPEGTDRVSHETSAVGKRYVDTQSRSQSAEKTEYADEEAVASKESYSVNKSPEYEKGFLPSPVYGSEKTYGIAPGYGLNKGLAPGYGLNKGYISPGFGYNKGYGFAPGFGTNKGYGGHAALIPIALVPVYSHHGYGGYGGFGYGGHPYGKGEPVKTITYTKEIPVPVPHPYPVHIEKKIPYPVKVPVAVPYDRPVPVHVYKPVPVPVERPVPYPVEKPIPYPVKVPVKVPIHHAVPYPVPTPVPVPVYVKPVHGHGYYQGEITKVYDDYGSASAEHDVSKSAYSVSDGKY